jgi:hypothetical protein
MLTKYKKTTDVQQTWREHGWKSPSEDPEIVAKWSFYRTLDTQKDIPFLGANHEEAK